MALQRGLLSEYFLTWVFSIIKLVLFKRLGVEDTPLVPERMSAQVVGTKAINTWEATNSLTRVLWVVSKRDILIGLAFSFINGLTTVVMRPLLLGSLVSQLEVGDENAALTFFIALLMTLVVESMSLVFVRHAFADIFGQNLVTAFSSLVKAKASRLPVTSSSSEALGLLGNDIYRLYENLRFGCAFFIGLSGMIGGGVVLVLSLGVSSAPGIAVLFIVVVGNSYLGRLASQAEEKDLESADKRLGILRQMINGIKAIKLCAWEESFLVKILAARADEMKHLRLFRLLNQSNVQLGRASPVLGAASSFLFFALSGAEVDAARLFSALNVFLALRLPLIVIPESITLIAAAKVSFKRITKFLELPEVTIDKKIVAKVDAALEIEGEYRWTEDSSFVLTLGQKIQLPKGKSLAIVSKVGEGKTTLLHAILGELVNKGGPAKVSTKNISFVSQHPFILGASVRENITLKKSGLNAREAKILKESVKRAALEEDLASFRNGIETIIGERGINFSGGQQQRVAVARAIYFSLCREGDTLMLIDDALAAVDTAVGDHLFFNGFMQHLKEADGNSLVMALNQPKYLKYFDYVLEIRQSTISKFISVESEESLEPLESYQEFVAERSLMRNTTRETVSGDSGSSENMEDDLYKDEEKDSGLVDFSVLSTWARGAGPLFLLACFLTCVFTYSLMAFTDVWFTLWIESVEERPSSTSDSESREEDLRFVYVYASACVGYLAFLLITSSMYTFASVRSSKALHHQAMENLLHCPISFFESTPSGRILSRLTSDLSTVDLNLGRFVDNFSQLGMVLVAQIVVVSVFTPTTLVVIVISLGFYITTALAVDRAQQVIKREASLAMGPLQLSLAELIDGKLFARKMQLDSYFSENFQHNLDHWTRYNFASLSLFNASIMIGGLLSLLISGGTGLYVIFGDTLSPSRGALALTYSFLIPYFMQNVGFLLSLLLASFSSLERVMDYSSRPLPQEPPWFLDEEKPIRFSKGSILFKEVTLVYRKGLQPAIRSLSFSIEDGQKVGIIGRTGAGKSSVIVLLLRILDPVSGAVYIDGRDIRSIGVLDLRKNVSIIPQTPLLLKGTISENVTPFGEAHKAALIECLDSAGLPKSMGLTASETLEVSAEKLSAGQKQLLSLARCLLNRRNKILILDEPTSNVDLITDKVVQRVIRDRFSHATTLTVAHRLETIRDVDVVIELDKGCLKQFGPPSQVLGNVVSEGDIAVS